MSFLSRNKNKKLQHYWFMSGILELMGCSFEEALPIWYKIYAALVIFCGTTVLVVFNFHTLYHGRDDMDAVSETMFYSVMGVSCEYIYYANFMD